jgi:carbon storage regulator CsrA
MLVLDRKVQEGFWIDDRIYVKVLGVGRRRVKLGIEAPSELKVVREELNHPAEGETPPEESAASDNGASPEGISPAAKSGKL